jgi:hypothetical protein
MKNFYVTKYYKQAEIWSSEMDKFEGWVILRIEIN